MKTAYILTCRDLRRLFPFAVVWTVLIFLSFAIKPAATNAAHDPVFYASITAWCAWVFVVSLIVHEAPPSGTTEFWMTRPIPAFQLFVSKLFTVLLLCVLMPVLMVILSKAAGLTVGYVPFFTGDDTNPDVTESFQTLITLALFFMLLASLTKNLAQYFLLIFGVIVALALSIFILSERETTGQVQVTQYPNLQEWASNVVFYPVVIFAIYNQYMRRNRKVTAVLLVLLVILFIGIQEFWPTTPKANPDKPPTTQL